MNIPHRCPICEGRGEVGKRLAQTGSVLISAKPQRFRCHGCYGTGIVWDQTFQINPIVPLTPWQPIGPTWGTGDLTISNSDCPGIVNPQNNPFSNPKLIPGKDGVLTPQVPLTDHEKLRGLSCACSPYGEPHSDDCKGSWPFESESHGAR